MAYLFVKWLHIISATILFGTGIGTAFTLFMANRRRDIAGIHYALRHVVLADWVFTAPAVIVQPITGLYLAHVANYSLSEPWLLWALILYAFAGLCWIPVVWLQLRMRNLVAEARTSGTELPRRYWRYDRWWTVLGSLAFPAVMLILWLMVVKPE